MKTSRIDFPTTRQDGTHELLAVGGLRQAGVEPGTAAWPSEGHGITYMRHDSLRQQ